MKKTITIKRLAELGIKGDVYPEEWPWPPVMAEDSDHGFGWVVFADEGHFWKLEYEFHPEDWIGTNDLLNSDDYAFEVVEMREVWVPE